MTSAPPFAVCHQVTVEEREAIRRSIDRDELVRRILQLCNIPSPMRGERAAGEYVHAWMREEGFDPRKVGLVEDRFNVVGRYGGHGDGPSLLFTSHLDTESPFYSAVDRHTYRPGGAEKREWLESWLEGERFHGYAVANDRGPMACFLLAASALKRAGIALDGTLYLTACPGEIGPEPEPTEGHEGIANTGRELGAAYMLAHGGVAPDFAIAAEGTDFGLNWAACGYCYYRITLYGEAIFTPILDHARTPRDNPIVRMGQLVAAVTAWAERYEAEHTYHSPGGGTVVPKVQIGAIRGGNPQAIGASSEACSLYLEIITGPRQTVGQVDRELKQVLRAAGIDNCEVEPYAVRTGFEADPQAVQPLRQAVDLAHRQVRGGPVQVGHPVFSSMWRDHNVFNMNRIPAVTMGPVRWLPSIEDMIQCTQWYALTALALCGRHRPGQAS